MSEEYSNPGEFYFPFSELILHDEFIIHTSFLGEDAYSSPEFIKTGKNEYKNLNTQEVFEIPDSEVNRTKVALVPTASQLALI